ncbi:MAG: hypothetical protein HC910_12340 [Spirulinaceae cyanobacterium SM2_1_0]|nr:hypothetical protein [Spirulinaceae cyanobacterium SM2_1_0]
MSRSPFWHPVFWRLALSIWLVYLFHFRHLAAGSDRFVILVQALVERGTIDLAYYASEPFYQPFLVDIFDYGDRTLININPGLAFLAVPAWACTFFFYQFWPVDAVGRHEAIHYWLTHFVSFATTTALFSALTAWLIAGFVYQRCQNLSRAVFAALLYSFGSIAFFFSTRLNQNIAITFVAIAVFILLFAPELLGWRSPRWPLAAIGFLLAWGWFIDATVLPVLLVAGGVLSWRYRRAIATLRLLCLGAFPPLLGQLLYNHMAFGNPLWPTTAVIAQLEAESLASTRLGFSSFDFQSLGTYLFSPEAGLFIYMPYIGMSVFYFLHHWRETRRLQPAEKWFITFSFGFYLLLIGTIPATYLYSLFGPRYLLPMLPFFCVIFSLYLRRRELQLAVVLVGLSFVLNLAGAQLGNDTSSALLTLGVYAVKGPWLPVLDWLQSDFATITGFSPSFVTPWGLLLMLAFCLTAIWLPYGLQRQRPGASGG